MVDKAKLMERLMATYLDELDEHVRAFNVELMALEKDPADDEGGERLRRLFRAAHSLKGASRAVDMVGIEQVCHRMEDVFSGFRDGNLQPTPEICSVLFSVADAIESAGMQLREKSLVDNEALSATLPALEAVVSGGTVALPVSAPVSENESRHTTGTRGHSDDVSEAARPTVVLQSPPEPATTDEAPSKPADDFEPVAVPRAQSLATTVRVAEDKLDSLLAQSGELLVARQRVEARPGDLDPLLDSIALWRTEWRNIAGIVRQLVQNDGADPLLRRSERLRERVAGVLERNGERWSLVEKQLEKFSRDLLADSRQLKLASTVLQDDIHRIRMLPFAEACAGLERAVRDVCRATGKQVELIIEGGDIEVDRSVLEGLGDPLMHLVRNAVDHGIESPSDRAAAGKSLSAKVTVRASIEGAEVAVMVGDDGRGLDLARIRQRLRSRGMYEPADEGELARCIFLPGFSTVELVTDVSGRGVGMDVVKSRIESLRGRIDISSQPGFGTRFILSVPLTLTTVPALFVRSSGQTFAFPTSTVSRLVRFTGNQVKRLQGRSVLSLGEVPVQVVSLAEILNFPEMAVSGGQQVAVLTSTGNQRMLFVVDEVLAEHEAVVKTLGARIRQVPHISGAITLRSGVLALLLNTTNLIRTATTAGRALTAKTSEDDLARTSASAQAPAVRRVLVVDDSMTTRTLLKSILETAGYDVLASAGGQVAWETLQEEEVDLVVCDVDMPRMTGFELTQKIRQCADRRNLPVILLTSRDSDADKTQGVEAGADAYLVKSSFDQSRVLATVEQFI